MKMVNLIAISIIFTEGLPRPVHAGQGWGQFWGSLGATKATVIRKAIQLLIKAHGYQREM